MSTKMILAWIDGAVQEIEVEDMVSPEMEPSIEERVSALENKQTIITSVILLADAWTGSVSPYSQVVTIDRVTSNSMVSLQPTPEQLVVWQDEGLAFTALNDNGTVHVYVAGDKPTEDIIVQVEIREVVVV